MSADSGKAHGCIGCGAPATAPERDTSVSGYSGTAFLDELCVACQSPTCGPQAARAILGNKVLPRLLLGWKPSGKPQ